MKQLRLHCRKNILEQKLKKAYNMTDSQDALTRNVKQMLFYQYTEQLQNRYIPLFIGDITDVLLSDIMYYDQSVTELINKLNEIS